MGSTSDGLETYRGADLTAADWGLVSGGSAYVTREGSPTAEQLADMLDRQWTGSHGVTELVTAALRSIARDRTCGEVYTAVLRTLFTDVDDTVHDPVGGVSGFYDSTVWNMLYPFQRDGVLGAIDKLERHNGCIIADSVGLGKTFEGLAVIKYYLERNHRVLVLAPKRLRENWTLWTQPDDRNVLADDRLHYTVLNHTDLSREAGMSGDVDLEHLRWQNFDLVVIDESHNFRNNPPVQDRLTRYQRLMEQVIKAGVPTKVLMLSATPVNTRLTDLRNQIAFATEGDDAAFTRYGIESVEATMRRAQAKFNEWAEADVNTSAQHLVQALGMDYIRLLDLMTIARSRKHIEKYYGGDAGVGTFPERLPPITKRPPVDDVGAFDDLASIDERFNRLSLAAYAPLGYVLAPYRRHYADLYDRQVGSGEFRQADREQSLVHLMRVNLLKRLESSVHSFGLTVAGLIDRTRAMLETVEAGSSTTAVDDGGEPGAAGMDEVEDLMVGTKVQVSVEHIDRLRMAQDLRDDLVELEALAARAAEVTPARDRKLSELRDVVAAKVAAPINPGNRKVLVFTSFSDTAEYLFDQLAPWAQAQGLHVGLVTGTACRSTIDRLPARMPEVLGAFSPVSKKANRPKGSPEIDLLIATDAISEGQNLQDCDTVVNYDIHWNPVRIVQRFGRVDRLGSTNTAVQLVNFWPDVDLDDYIRLEARVAGRMVLLDVSATGEENVLETQAGDMNDLAFRRRQLEQMQQGVVDVEDLSGSVSLTDLTLNDFRMDLAAQEAVSQHLPGMLGAVELSPRLARQGTAPGAVFLLRVENSPVGKDYPFAPYFVVHVDVEGRVTHRVDDPKSPLELLRAHSEGVDDSAMRRLASSTQGLVNMGTYRQLLDAAIDAVTGVERRRRVASLFAEGPSDVGAGRGAEVDVVAWVALLPPGGETS
ncbi:helicase-related protein [Kytococcus sedentarius]|uniref:helicase-related protein n=1 Tax=Kytococcus sedentarius TaxID=1276 RepID=UPI0038790E47